ncbi:hypothetical protein WLF18_22505 [Pseudomonas shirazensis]|jgi:hypothetical protein|uniref:Uncharacterized protein n=1 Tax=Pseudomonas shirazensis TaxID=2745494 RepID=A0ABU9A5J3_9PSED|nr:hypothetical protein [Pseudomonas shirazensis]MBV4501004.1 hypothetical protein [Pseudomonas shirazensis]
MNVQQKSAIIWRIWAGFDAVHIVSYMGHSLARGNVPFVADAYSALETVERYGEGAYVFVALSWTLELSILISCWLFWTQRQSARWLSFAQTPLRLFLMVPSVSLLTTALGFYPSYSALLAIGLVVLSETLKCLSVWWFGMDKAQRIRAGA